MSRQRRILHGFVLLVATGAAPSGAQTIIPNEMHKSLTFELHSVRDNVQLYPGDPQYLFRLELRPVGSLPPRIDFSNYAQVATLRVRDLTLFEATEPLPGDEEEKGDEDLFVETEKRVPDSQGWNVRLMPAAPTEFVLQCEGGKGVFDFTDMQVQAVHLIADTSDVRIDFNRPNSMQLQRFKVTVTGGSLELHDFLNARPKLATLQLASSKCDVELTGKPFAGEGEIFFEGVPARMHLTVPHGIGLRLDGPASIITRFDAPNMRRVESSLATVDYDTQRCRLHLYFSQTIPKLQVDWSE